MTILYVDTLTFAQGEMYIIAANEGLVYLGTPNTAFDEVETWAQKHFKGYSFEENSEKLKPYVKQFTAYFYCNLNIH